MTNDGPNGEKTQNEVIFVKKKKAEEKNEIGTKHGQADDMPTEKHQNNANRLNGNDRMSLNNWFSQQAHKVSNYPNPQLIIIATESITLDTE